MQQQQIVAYQKQIQLMQKRMEDMARNGSTDIRSPLSGSQSLPKLDKGMVSKSPPPMKAEDATQDLMLEARESLINGADGHAQKVLVAAIGNFPDENDDLLDQTAKVSGPLPTLVVPESPRVLGEGQASRTQQSFMEGSESYAQKALIHSIASRDPDFMVQLERPDGKSHVHQADESLGTPRADPEMRTDAKMLIDTSNGIAMKSLIHAVDSRPEGEPDQDRMDRDKPMKESEEVEREKKQGVLGVSF